MIAVGPLLDSHNGRRLPAAAERTSSRPWRLMRSESGSRSTADDVRDPDLGEPGTARHRHKSELFFAFAMGPGKTGTAVRSRNSMFALVLFPK